jgi:hypothetical protein
MTDCHRQRPGFAWRWTVHLQDVDNRYQPAHTPYGRPIRIFDELLCRAQPNGEPDVHRSGRVPYDLARPLN